MTPLNVRLLHASAIIPTRSTPHAAGLDLYAIEQVALLPNTPTAIRTGIAIQIPHGHVGHVWDRSGLGRKGVRVLAGVIDSDYEGELVVCVALFGQETISIRPGDRVAQLVIVPLAQVTVREDWDPTRKSSRGTAGFGSSGC